MTKKNDFINHDAFECLVNFQEDLINIGFTIVYNFNTALQ